VLLPDVGALLLLWSVHALMVGRLDDVEQREHEDVVNEPDETDEGSPRGSRGHRG
jgi:hypothetical protein